LPILGFRFPYVGHLDLSLSPSLKRQGASCCQVDYCEVEYLHHEDCSAAVLGKVMDQGCILMAGEKRTQAGSEIIGTTSYQGIEKYFHEVL
jgi:hypothetical protein